jgi:hypothetical protein
MLAKGSVMLLVNAQEPASKETDINKKKRKVNLYIQGVDM